MKIPSALKEHGGLIATILVLLLTTAVATNLVQVPDAASASPLATGILIIAALGAASVDISVGVSLLLLTAVLFFRRNVQRTLSSAKAVYGETSIAEQPHATALPFASESSGPRSYDEFDETNPTNPALGPEKVTEGFEPAPYGDDSSAPADGQYPTDESRPFTGGEVRGYTYRPEEDTGDNGFKRYGPDLDEKKASFGYKETL
jgi:hypothetical protein